MVTKSQKGSIHYSYVDSFNIVCDVIVKTNVNVRRVLVRARRLRSSLSQPEKLKTHDHHRFTFSCLTLNPMFKTIDRRKTLARPRYEVVKHR